MGHARNIKNLKLSSWNTAARWSFMRYDGMIVYSLYPNRTNDMHMFVCVNKAFK